LLEPAPEVVHDEFLGTHAFDPGLEAGDLVVWTKLGVPAYQLAVVVDDARQGVSDVVRGDDLLASAARQQLIARHLGVPHARWWHVPLVYGDDGKRLAKRHGAHSLAQLRADGVPAAAVIGWCAASLGLIDRPRALEPREFLARATPDALRAAMPALRVRPSVFGADDPRSLGSLG
jgi:glutamyl-tRNA synthetase